MAINNVKDTQSLLHDIEDWMDNPKFQPQEQNKWFFGEGLSYYTQLCEVVKVLTYLQDNFKIVIANEKSLEQAYNEVKDLPNQFNALSTKVDDLTNTVSDLPTRIQELETKVTKLISDVSSQLTRIETLERGVVSINAKDISQDNEIASIKTKNQEQDTLINKNTNDVTELKNADYLKELILQNSATITFTGGIKENGVQTYVGQVIGSIPANLTENLTFSNNNVTPIVYGIGSNDIIEQEKYIATAISCQSVNNGKANNSTIPVSKFNNNHFEKNTNNIISIKNSVLEPYETKANASATYVAKNEATGYNDILTKTLASATYETIENASNYVAKSEAVGYDDILTNANASETYETKQNASATYETKANANETYVSQNSLIDKIYPIGSIYLNVSNINPNTLFNGTMWEQIKDKFLLGSGDLYSNGNEGGEEQHTLTISELPSHTHDLYYDYNGAQHAETKHILQTTAYKAGNIYNTMPNAVDPYGENQAHNNMPPYLAVNIWKRIS